MNDGVGTVHIVTSAFKVRIRIFCTLPSVDLIIITGATTRNNDYTYDSYYDYNTRKKFRNFNFYSDRKRRISTRLGCVSALITIYYHCVLSGISLDKKRFQPVVKSVYNIIIIISLNSKLDFTNIASRFYLSALYHILICRPSCAVCVKVIVFFFFFLN